MMATKSRCSQCGFEIAEPLAKNPLDFEFAAPGSRHYTLLNSDEVPLDPELDMIASVVSETETHLARLDDVISKTNAHLACLEDEVASVRERMRQLEEQRAPLHSYRAQNQAVRSPLRRIPPEVLAEIFLWTLPTPQRAVERLRFSAMESPWVLTHVSRRWRAVAISSPALWSLLPITCGTKNNSLYYPLSMIETHLARASKLKIHFYGTEADSQSQTEIFRLLAAHADRWEELSLGLTSALVPLLDSLMGRLPHLRRTWIQWNGRESQAEGVETIEIFESAPSLVAFGAAKYHYIPYLLPAKQLTSYQLDAPWGTHRDILKLATGLIEARVNVPFADDEPWPDPGPIISMSCLRRLFVSHVEILQFLQFPVLKEIALDMGLDEDVLPHLEPSLIRSACPLRMLCFDGCPPADATLSVLQRFPSIKELAIIVDTVEDSGRLTRFMTSLTVSKTEETTVVAPQLNRVSLGSEDKGYIDYDTFLGMVESRWRSAHCALKGAALLIAAGGTPVRSDLGVLRKEGLDLVLAEGLDASNAIDYLLMYPGWN
ncbi:hypothetical protein B0H16DRAFT_1360738 [Mycena metata]|uniref:F-box domain-containing protein n=1 Tax=Mycena metata TaxID=1033252 RepID=A0AAD7NVP9_9AGAR|nr:hypothetical protein B0H16DRAFT_1360738 [Mycena metata]